MLKKTGFALVIISLFILLGWYKFIALKEIPMEQNKILQQYEYRSNDNVEISLVKISPHQYSFTYLSFDGSIVNGQITYPEIEAKNYPVLIGISAMGRSYIRWFVESFKERPTITQVNKISELADKNGYVVISIDARYHGKRKDPDRTLRSIMNDLHFFGDKEGYEAMIRDTVLDHRVLLDWIEQQENLNHGVTVAGYSMGGQVSLILSSLDKRVKQVISIVPPFIDDKTALVAPKNFVSMLKNQQILLLTADDDENASSKQNDKIYEQIPVQGKQRIEFQSGHILPEDYVEKLSHIFTH